jgi:hypothetical protein
MMSEQNLYVCCMFSVSCPHKPVRALEDKMDGTWEESVVSFLLFKNYNAVVYMYIKFNERFAADGRFQSFGMSVVVDGVGG